MGPKCNSCCEPRKLDHVDPFMKPSSGEEAPIPFEWFLSAVSYVPTTEDARSQTVAQ